MNYKPLPPDDSWESDAVWELLDKAPPRSPAPNFADNTVRAARLASSTPNWWRRLFAPAPLAGLAATAAALVIAVLTLIPAPIHPASPSSATSDEAFAGIQELAETEVLCAAVDNLDNFTDTELVCLIGF
ncbi:MAG: hypothetical protein WCP35_09415 [Verrucomicrobiota bacterium]